MSFDMCFLIGCYYLLIYSKMSDRGRNKEEQVNYRRLVMIG